MDINNIRVINNIIKTLIKDPTDKTPYELFIRYARIYKGGKIIVNPIKIENIVLFTNASHMTVNITNFI